MSVPRFSLCPAYDSWYEYLDLNNWVTENLDGVIEKVCLRAYRLGIPARHCVRDIPIRVLIESGRVVSPMRVLGFYRRAKRTLVDERTAYFGLITREDGLSRPAPERRSRDGSDARIGRKKSR